MIHTDYLRKILDYNPDTGEFRWLINRGKLKHNKVAGTVRPDGYLQIRIDYKIYLSHRLAWLFTYGEWPTCFIDHIDRNPSNNKIVNLRLATYSQNNANSLSKRALGKGVRKVYNKYIARIKKDGIEFHLGTFKDAESARVAYKNAAIKYFGEYAAV